MDKKIWYKDGKFYGKILGTFGGVFIGQFAIIEIFEWAGLEIFNKEEGTIIKLLIYTLFSLVITLFFTIIEVGKFYREVTCEKEKDVSLLAMIKEAYDENRLNEVVKLGSAVLDSLWYGDKYSLRYDIANYVKQAATQLEDTYSLAKVLIEDLGNGKLEVEKNPDDAIEYMDDGVEIAKDNKYYYLCARGNRNLSCAFALKAHKCDNLSDREKYLKRAEQYSDEAEKSIKKIIIKGEKIDAEASILYAKSKIESLRGNILKSIEYLKRVEKLYEELGKIASYNHKAKDRLVKVIREIGKNLLELSNIKKIELEKELKTMNNNSVEEIQSFKEKNIKEIKSIEKEGLDYLEKKALVKAENQKNYNNIMFICNILIKYYMEKGSPGNYNRDINFLIDKGNTYLDRVDAENIKNAFIKLKDRFKG